MAVMASGRNCSVDTPKLFSGILPQTKCSPKEDPQGERHALEERFDSFAAFHGASHD